VNAKAALDALIDMASRLTIYSRLSSMTTSSTFSVPPGAPETGESSMPSSRDTAAGMDEPGRRDDEGLRRSGAMRGAGT